MYEITEANQREIDLDFSKWSFQRSRAKLPSDHKTWEAIRDRTLAAQRRENDQARQRRLNAEAQVKAEKAKLAQSAIDAELDPTKQRLQLKWLADHPGKTANDFESGAWPLLRQDLITERKESVMQATAASLAASGRYAI